jgi:hypothetical protein
MNNLFDYLAGGVNHLAVCRACKGELRIYNVRGVCIDLCNCKEPEWTREYRGVEKKSAWRGVKQI